MVAESTSDEEAAATSRLTSRLRNMMSTRDKGSLQRRDVHTKMHGTMKAEFTIPNTLPPELSVGLFARPGTYETWVRFSNSARTADPDRKGDIRGMAIKVMGVHGRKILEAEANAETHDFVLISASSFPSQSAAEFDELVAAVLGTQLDQVRYFLSHPRALWILLTTMVRHANILQVRYFSAVPYAFGGHAVKYVVTPRVAKPDPMPSRPSHNFLREAAVAQLADGDAVFDFAVQFQRDEASMPLEDPSRKWSLALSPPRNVASLRIEKQRFDTDATNAFGEDLSFTPWHCLPEHQPLGAINLARKSIYESLSAFRHDANHVSQREPTGWNV